ncbi:unnamed protein product [Ectocarpus sp. 12 AP-2014]
MSHDAPQSPGRPRRCSRTCWLPSVRRVAPFQPACPRNRKPLHLPSAAPGPLTSPPESSLARTRLIFDDLICLPKPLTTFHDGNRNEITTKRTGTFQASPQLSRTHTPDLP